MEIFRKISSESLIKCSFYLLLVLTENRQALGVLNKVGRYKTEKASLILIDNLVIPKVPTLLRNSVVRYAKVCVSASQLSSTKK